jgi:hypothetical protein
MYLASELPYLSPPEGVGAFADAILSARNKRLWLAQLGISYADPLRKLIEDHETPDTAQFNQMAIRKRADLDSHTAARAIGLSLGGAPDISFDRSGCRHFMHLWLDIRAYSDDFRPRSACNESSHALRRSRAEPVIAAGRPGRASVAGGRTPRR